MLNINLTEVICLWVVYDEVTHNLDGSVLTVKKAFSPEVSPA